MDPIIRNRTMRSALKDLPAAADLLASLEESLKDADVQELLGKMILIRKRKYQPLWLILNSQLEILHFGVCSSIRSSLEIISATICAYYRRQQLTRCTIQRWTSERYQKSHTKLPYNVLTFYIDCIFM